jgi:V/A-type H+/Na+-transporting ATPase subunit I
MIVKMAKVEVVGPKHLLMEVLDLVREQGIFQAETGSAGFVTGGEGAKVKTLALDEETMAQRLFFEDLRQKIDTLFTFLPGLESRPSYLEPLSVIDAVAGTIDRHVAHCGDIYRRREGLRKEGGELEKYRGVLATLESLLSGMETKSGLDFVGITLRETALLERVTGALDQLTEGKFEIVTSVAEDGTMIGLIAVTAEMAERVRRALSDERVPEMSFPASFQDLPFPRKLQRIGERLAEIARDTAAIDGELELFAHRWKSIYLRVREWLDQRLALLKATAFVHETAMCFFLYGWMPATDVAGLSRRLRERFGGRVVLEEKQIREEDLDKVPVTLQNPPYFRPFEILIRLLPLPRYSSYDPTPFVAIFFPLFFGMMLGDAGHGAVLVLAALVLERIFRKRRNIRDAARILLVSSLYAILFGFFYGEFFGEFGREMFGFRPLVTERRTAILPMIFFALSVGIMHVVIGLLLGVISALKRKTGKEALFKLLMILAVIGLVALFSSLVLPVPHALTKAIAITLAVAIPLFFITGGLMAPLELLKVIGNIISYVRIMAIGLTSVYLAMAANNLAGVTGDIITGTIVAGIFHAVAIVVGVFSPTIHALRLHYVEFFSKFLEHGGRRFEPLKK